MSENKGNLQMHKDDLVEAHDPPNMSMNNLISNRIIIDKNLSFIKYLQITSFSSIGILNIL